MRSRAAASVLVFVVAGCGTSEPEPPAATEPSPTEAVQADEDEPDLQALEDALAAQLQDRDDGLGLYITGIEAGGGNRVRVLTQLDESQTEEANAICNNTTVAAYSLDDIEVSGVDVAAAGGRNIAHCEPRV